MEDIISVVVPVYNTEAYLEECIESILGQTFPAFELILVDDGSTDKSGVICDRYAQRDKRVKVIHKENGGLADACRTGIEHTTGKYLLFVDSDDWIDFDMLQRLFDAAEEHQAQIVLCHFIRESGNQSVKREMHRLPKGFYGREQIVNMIFPQLISDGTFEGKIVAADTRAARLFSRDLIIDNLEFYRNDICYGEDLVLSFACFLDAQSVYVFDDYYPYHYRKVNTSMTQAYTDNMWQKMVMLNKNIELIAKTKAVYDFDLQIKSELVSFAVLSVNHLFRHPNIQFKDRLAAIREICNDTRLMTSVEEVDFSKYERNKRLMITLIKLKLPTIIYLLKVLQVKFVLKET